VKEKSITLTYCTSMTMKQTPPNTLNSIFTVAKHLKSHNRTAFYQRNQSFI